MQRTEIDGHPVYHDDEDHHGVEYLNSKIDRNEAKVLFDYAKTHGTAEFETQGGKNYSLVHNNEKGNYEIVKR
jgi:hypothetical protein